MLYAVCYMLSRAKMYPKYIGVMTLTFLDHVTSSVT